MAIKKVLVVDDSATERHVLGELLTKQGFEVILPRVASKGSLRPKAPCRIWF